MENRRTSWRAFLSNGGPLILIDRIINHPRLIMESASIMARDTHTIHPLLPSSQSFTGPGAHPLCFAIGERMAHPTIAPTSICSDVDVPMIMPCPMYAGDGLSVQSQSLASVKPSIGKSRIRGMKKLIRVCKPVGQLNQSHSSKIVYHNSRKLQTPRKLLKVS